MPQARRKTPFSGKAKKQQLQMKKQKRPAFVTSGSSSSGLSSEALTTVAPSGGGGRGERGRYALKFYRESDAELQQRKQDASRELVRLPETALETEQTDFFPPELAMPTRPPWNFEMSKLQLEMQENKYFTEYINSLQRSRFWKEISYFELNLETWRQLWRVLEMSDVVLLVVDVRYPVMMFPPSLYKHVVEDCHKDMILVLNKIDLVQPGLVAAWKAYLKSLYPELHVLYFTRCTGYNLRGPTSDKAGLQTRRYKGRQRMAAEGASALMEACRSIVGDRVDLTTWQDKIRQESEQEYDETTGLEIGETVLEKPDTSYYSHERFKNGVLTIGCVGQPNVGKSSMINSIMGRKVVSVSSTPGHTKHFQTIFITPTVRLCDCPGLVFPSLVPRNLQILMGSYPIAQLREPYSAIRYLAERLDLPRLLRISHPEGDDTWSPRDIGDGWAKKRGYLTAKAARLDTYRAANSLLRIALDGKICLALTPPGYTAEKDKWSTSAEARQVEWVLARGPREDAPPEPADSATSDDSGGGGGDEVSDDDDDDDDCDDDDDDDTNPPPANKFAGLLDVE